MADALSRVESTARTVENRASSKSKKQDFVQFLCLFAPARAKNLHIQRSVELVEAKVKEVEVEWVDECTHARASERQTDEDVRREKMRKQGARFRDRKIR